MLSFDNLINYLKKDQVNPFCLTEADLQSLNFDTIQFLKCEYLITHKNPYVKNEMDEISEQYNHGKTLKLKKTR